MAYDLDWAPLMCRAQRACMDIAAVRGELAITWAETQRVLALARQVSGANGWGDHRDAAPVIAAELPADAASHADGWLAHPCDAPPILAELSADEDLHEMAMEVLRMMRELLNGFPVEWQVSMIRVITARTMLVVAAQLKQQPTTLSA
jgi:hypothetical protein